MRTITLELLRHGPSHNQLLSPLTEYFALCENHAAVTLHVPFEHNQFLHRLRAFSYELDEEARKFQLNDTARVLSDLFAQLPGLVAELNREDLTAKITINNNKHECNKEITHIRLIISASELALLPFELALAPNGLPGANQYLLLQSQKPVCLTRETRRIAEQVIEWPKEPKILFVAASPPEVGSIPVESHLLALRKIIDPWVRSAPSQDEDKWNIKDHLFFLPDATAEAIEAECAQGRYTHVHILAHGVEFREGYDIRYGLAMHNASNFNGPMDIITGERLATILRPSLKSAEEALARPMVVTLASCHSGNVGTVYGMGASIAHSLHEAGIPLVIAGQFPLSFAGSVMMVEILYEGLLKGEDPRISMNDLRRRLHSQYPSMHDWASLTAYASLPPQFEQQLTDIQIRQAFQAFNVAMDNFDRFFQDDSKDLKLLLPPLQKKIKLAFDNLHSLLDQAGEYSSRICGLLASALKRRSYIQYRLNELSEESSLESNELSEESFLELLLQARSYYWRSFQTDYRNVWGIVQYLSIDLVLERINNSTIAEEYKKLIPQYCKDNQNQIGEIWSMAQLLSFSDLRSKDEEQRLNALSNLIELNLIGIFIKDKLLNTDPDELANNSERYAKDLVNLADENSLVVFSTKRQLGRYIEWYTKFSDIEDDMFKTIAHVSSILPERKRCRN